MKMHAAASDKGPLRAEYHLLWPSGGRIGALEQKLCERWRSERVRFRCVGKNTSQPSRRAAQTRNQGEAFAQLMRVLLAPAKCGWDDPASVAAPQ